MKMAKASEADLEMAMELSRFLEDIEGNDMPSQISEDPDNSAAEWFDVDDREHCRKAVEALIAIVRKGSIFRVTFGMAVLCDPRNKLLDPNADTLEAHPDTVANATNAERYQAVRRGQKWSVIDGIGNTLRGDDLDAAIDAAMAPTGAEQATK